MKLEPRVKILLASLLLIAAVAAWYALYLQGAQSEGALTPAPAPVSPNAPRQRR